MTISAARKTLSLLVADSQEIVRAGVRAMLAQSAIKIVGEATDVAGTLAVAKKLKPAVVLLDAALPGGDSFELAKKLRQTLPAIRSILVTAIDNPTYMARAHAVGAANCLLKGVTQKELVVAIENAAVGKPAADNGPFARIVASMSGRAKSKAAATNLTPREEQVLLHVALGLSNDEIGSSLEISVETVKEHVQHLLRKLSVSDRTQAAVLAVQSGWV